MSEGSTIVGLGFALLSALGWSGLDAARKGLAKHVDPLPAVVLLTWGQVPLFLAWWGVALAGPGDGAGAVASGYWLPGLMSVAFNLAANLLFMTALRLSPLSATVPLLAFVPVFATLVAWPLLGELPSAASTTGIGLVVAGALALNARRSGPRGLVGLVRNLLEEKGSLPMLGVALSWGLNIALDKVALDGTPPAFHGLMLNLGVGVVLLAWLMARGNVSSVRQGRPVWRLLVVAVCLSGFALAMQLVALSSLYVGVLEAVKRTVGLAMSVAVGRMLFAESVTIAKLAGVVLMAFGAALVVLG